jgi:hypothetical protein
MEEEIREDGEKLVSITGGIRWEEIVLRIVYVTLVNAVWCRPETRFDAPPPLVFTSRKASWQRESC